MLKKTLWIASLAVFSFTLLGCGKVEKVNLSFDDAYNVFKDNYVVWDFNGEKIANVLEGKWKNISTIEVKTKNPSQTGFSLSLKTQWESDQDEMETKGTTKLSASANMNNQDYKLGLDLSFIQKFGLGTGGIQQFFKVDNFDIFLGSGNMQREFVKSMVDSLSGSWIKMDIFDKLAQNQPNPALRMNSFEDGKKIMTNLFSISKIMENTQFLENLGNTEYQGHNAFKVKIKPEAVKTLIKTIFTGTNFANEDMNVSEVENLDITGLLILKDTDEVSLLLNNFGETESNTTTTVLFEENKVEINVLAEDGTKSEILIEKTAKNKIAIDFVIGLPKMNREENGTIKGEFELVLDFSDKKIENDITGKLIVSSKDLLEVLGKDTLEISIAVNSENEKVNEVSITLPASSLLFSQLMSDKFGMPYMQNVPQDVQQTVPQTLPQAEENSSK